MVKYARAEDASLVGVTWGERLRQTWLTRQTVQSVLLENITTHEGWDGRPALTAHLAMKVLGKEWLRFLGENVLESRTMLDFKTEKDLLEVLG